jgi:NADH dehydrogenase
MRTNVQDPDSIERAVEGADAVINLVGILFEKGRRTFDAVHHIAAKNIAESAARAGVDKLVHVSALGADANSPSKYAQSKAKGAQAVLAAFPNATIMEPSVIFGPEDDFFNKFAAMGRFTPMLPLFCNDVPNFSKCPISGLKIIPGFQSAGGAKFQPVFVGDVADAICKAIDHDKFQGKTYQLVGPKTYSMQEIMEMVSTYTGQKKWIVPMPFFVAKVLAVLTAPLPKPIITSDQIKLLQIDNVGTPDAAGLDAFGITPDCAESVLPTYLRRYKKYYMPKSVSE